MPADQRDARADYVRSHIPSSRFFDLDQYSDHTIPLPHMLPTAPQFIQAAKELGLSPDDKVVVYDTKGVFSSPRVWYTLKVFGLKEVAVLNGGFPSWLHHKLPTESGSPPPPSAVGSTFLPTTSIPFKSWVASLSEMKSNSVSTSPFLVLDARSSGRFTGAEPEPRPGLSSGHMPNSISVPYASLVGKENEEGVVMVKKEEELRKIFKEAGVDLEGGLKGKEVITSCGTGVTACTIALSLTLLGHNKWRVYDGSWTEWAQQKDVKIEKGKVNVKKI